MGSTVWCGLFFLLSGRLYKTKLILLDSLLLFRPCQNVFNVPSECLGEATKVSADPARPNIASSFYAAAEIEIHSDHHHEKTRFGFGEFASDFTDKRFVERFDFRDGLRLERLLNLVRYDLKTEYFLDSEDFQECDERPVNSTMVPPFDWVKDAKYEGKRIVHEVSIDFWGADFGGVHLAVGVEEADVTRPVAFEREDSHGLVRYFFRDWDATKPQGVSSASL